MTSRISYQTKGWRSAVKPPIGLAVVLLRAAWTTPDRHDRCDQPFTADSTILMPPNRRTAIGSAGSGTPAYSMAGPLKRRWMICGVGWEWCWVKFLASDRNTATWRENETGIAGLPLHEVEWCQLGHLLRCKGSTICMIELDHHPQHKVFQYEEHKCSNYSCRWCSPGLWEHVSRRLL